MTTGEALSQRILFLCRERDLSVNKLCTLSGVTQSTVNNLLSGRNTSATVSTIKKLCDGLEITLGEFFSTPEFDGLEQEIK
jgi:transcriptional regulator with XRE-family HTH domain